VAAADKKDTFRFKRPPRADSFMRWLGCRMLAGMLDKMAFYPLHKSLAIDLALGYGQDGALRILNACLQLEAV
jgi:hypothetical protein